MNILQMEIIRNEFVGNINLSQHITFLHAGEESIRNSCHLVCVCDVWGYDCSDVALYLVICVRPLISLPHLQVACGLLHSKSMWKHTKQIEANARTNG